MTAYQRLLTWAMIANHNDPEWVGSFLAGLTLGIALVEDDPALATRLHEMVAASDRWPTLAERHASASAIREVLR